ncbi:MAG: sulfurtransferase TusA family protein [Proteobacteria bacterium]|jgi:tRNA 2-thiouridine synthesizing protein A|nr:sulfurtransferase TusA family protein [Pseudomonadota bacterium]
MSEIELDARRLLCPLPVIRTQDRIKTLQDGDILTVTGTDPGVMQDIPAWCRVHGHKVIESQQQDREYIISILVCK